MNKSKEGKMENAPHPGESEMVFVEGGTFTMGCTTEHQVVTLSSFKIGKYQVTQAQWKAVMGDNPSAFKGDNLPVETVSWNDAQKFITKLNALTGKNYRLATEAEWEYAARGGSHASPYKYSGSNNIDKVAWYKRNSDYQTHPVGTKTPNALGIYDMSGNVWEWCNDRLGDYTDASQTNPQGSAIGPYRVIRGGGWEMNAYYARVSYRNGDSPNDRYSFIGFRLACSLE